MSSLKYIGRPPDTDASIATQRSIDNRRAAVSVSQADVDAAIAQRTSSLALASYVDQQDAAGGVLKTYVDQQDALYLNKSLINQANGPISLTNGKLVSASAAVKTNVPRGPRVWTKTSGWTDSGLTSTAKKTLGSFVVPDPGYKYFPVITGGGFEQAMSASGTDCRVDINVQVGSTSGAGVAFGTGKLGDTYSRCPISIVPDPAAGTSFTGPLTCFITTVRGFGSGSFYLYTANAYLTIIMMPIV